MKLNRHKDFMEKPLIEDHINEARKQISPEDKEALRVLNKQRSQLTGYHAGDDCPLGSPYGGYTVSDTRSAITSKSARIKNKYKTDADWNKEHDRKMALRQKAEDKRELYAYYSNEVYKSLSKEEKISHDLFREKKSIEMGRKSPNYRQEKAEFNKKVEEAGLKTSYLKDEVKKKMFSLTVQGKKDPEKIDTFNIKRHVPFLSFISKLPKFKSIIEPIRGTIGAAKFGII